MRHATETIFGAEVESIIYHGLGDIDRHGRHEPQCESSVIIRGEPFRCDFHVDHNGWPHSNSEGEVIWQ